MAKIIGLYNPKEERQTVDAENLPSLSGWKVVGEYNPQPGEVNQPQSSGLFRQYAVDPAITLLGKGVVGAGEATVGLADLVSGGHAGRALERATGYDPRVTKEFFEQYQTPEYRAKKAKLSEAEGIIGKAKVALTNPSLIVDTALESLPSMIGGWGIAKKLVPYVGLAVAGGIGEGLVTASQNAEQVRQEAPDRLLSTKQIALALGSGAATGAIGAVSGKIAQKLGIADVDTIFHKVDVDGKAKKGITRKIVEGVLQEGFLEELPQSVQEQMAQNLSLNKPITEGLDEAAVMGALSGGLMGGVANVVQGGVKADPVSKEMLTDQEQMAIARLMNSVSKAVKKGDQNAAAKAISSFMENNKVRDSVKKSYYNHIIKPPQDTGNIPLPGQVQAVQTMTPAEKMAVARFKAVYDKAQETGDMSGMDKAAEDFLNDANVRPEIKQNFSAALSEAKSKTNQTDTETVPEQAKSAPESIFDEETPDNVDINEVSQKAKEAGVPIPTDREFNAQQLYKHVRNELIKAGEISPDITTSDGKPFKTQNGLIGQLKARGLSDMYDVTGSPETGYIGKPKAPVKSIAQTLQKTVVETAESAPQGDEIEKQGVTTGEDEKMAENAPGAVSLKDIKDDDLVSEISKSVDAIRKNPNDDNMFNNFQALMNEQARRLKENTKQPEEDKRGVNPTLREAINGLPKEVQDSIVRIYRQDVQIESEKDAFVPDILNKKGFVRLVPDPKEKRPLVFFDLDKFKWINDNTKKAILPTGEEYPGGHPLGDYLLKTVGQLMVASRNEAGVEGVHLARAGGDEYQIFGDVGKTSKESIDKVAKILQDKVKQVTLEIEGEDGTWYTMQGIPLTMGFGESLADADVKVKEVKNAKPADPERKGKPETLVRRDQVVPRTPERESDSGMVEGEGPEGVQSAQEVARQNYLSTLTGKKLTAAYDYFAFTDSLTEDQRQAVSGIIDPTPKSPSMALASIKDAVAKHSGLRKMQAKAGIKAPDVKEPPTLPNDQRPTNKKNLSVDSADAIFTEALKQMQYESNNTDTRGTATNEAGETVAYSASSPQWIKKLNGSNKENIRGLVGKNGRDTKEPVFDRREIDNLIGKYLADIPFTPRQAKRFSYLKEIAETEIASKNPDLRDAREAESLEKEGYKIIGQDVPVGDLSVGDKFYGRIPGRDVQDTYTVVSVDENGDATLKDGITKTLDVFDTVEVVGIKEKGKQPSNKKSEPNQQDIPESSKSNTAASNKFRAVGYAWIDGKRRTLTDAKTIKRGKDKGKIKVRYITGPGATKGKTVDASAVKMNEAEYILKDKPGFKKTNEPATGLSVSEVRSITAPLLTGLNTGLKYNYVQSETEIGDATIQGAIKKKNAQGKIAAVIWQGNVWLVGDNLKDQAHVESAVLHEVFGHHGVESVLNPNQAKLFFTGVYESRKGEKDFQNIASRYKANLNTKAGQLEAAREYVAHLAETGVDNSIINRLIGMVRNALRKMGFTMKISDNDIRYLIGMGARKMRGGMLTASGISKDGMPLFQSVWHGTPHIWQAEPGYPHGRARLDKIGTGEGAQAYGWGIYFAENRDVGSEYAEKLARDNWELPPRRFLNGEELKHGSPEYHAGTLLSRNGMTLLRARKNVAGWISDGEKDSRLTKEVSGWKRTLEILNQVKSKKEFTEKPNPGQLYNLDIPEDVMHKLLDWDKPLSEQSEYVKKALEKEDIIDSVIKAFGGEDIGGDKIYLGIAGELAKKSTIEGTIEKISNSKKQAALYLASIGIPGNKYLDGMSRGKGDGSYNYVIWDQGVLDRIALLERNGEKLDAIREDQGQPEFMLDDSRYDGGTAASVGEGLLPSDTNYRSRFPKVRGGWTKEKIRSSLRKAESGDETNFYFEIMKFDSPGELSENLFYHGSGRGIGKLKPSITMSEGEAESFGGGGYGQRYWGISLSKDRNTASNFSGQSRYGSVAPVVLKKGAVVKSMPDIQDAVEIEDIIEDLWNQGVDAVKIGDWDAPSSEQEIVVLNPRAIAVGKPTSFPVFKKEIQPSFNEEQIDEMFYTALDKYTEKAAANRENRRVEFIKKYGREPSGLVHPMVQRIKDRFERIISSRQNGKPSFMLTDTDTAYLNAVAEAEKSGDWAKVQKMVDDAARKAGYTVEAWHGTDKDFNVFEPQRSRDIGSHFSLSKKIAESFGNARKFFLRVDDKLYVKDVFSTLQGDYPHYDVTKDLIDNGAIQDGGDILDLADDADNAFTEAKEENENIDVREIDLPEIRDFWAALNELVMSENVGKNFALVYENEAEGGGDSIAVFDPSQIKSADPVTSDADGRIIPLSERFNDQSDDIRFMMNETPETLSFGGRVKEKIKALADKLDTNESGRSKMREWKMKQAYNFLDSMDPLKQIQGYFQIQDEFLDAYQTERLRGKRESGLIKEFRREVLKPIIERMAKAGITFDMLDEYRHAKHAEEANKRLELINAKTTLKQYAQIETADTDNLRKQIAAIDEEAEAAKDADGFDSIETQKKYLALLNSQAPKSDKQKEFMAAWNNRRVRLAGITNEKAAEILTKYNNNTEIEAIRKEFAKIDDDRLNILESSGEITAQQAEAMRKAYKFYAPLYREGKDGRPASGRKTGAIGSPIKARAGSTRAVEEISAHTIANYENAISRSLKHETGRVLYDLVKETETNDGSVWWIEKQPKKPAYDKDGNIVYYPDMQEPVDGFYLKIDGQRYLVRVNTEDPTMARFLESIKTAPETNGLIKGLAAVNRWMAMVNTSLSPEFMATNFIRDLQTAGVHLEDTELKGMQKTILKRIPSAIKGIWQAERSGKKNGMSGWYRDFEKNGGKMGWASGYEEIKDISKRLRKELSEANGEAVAMATAKKLLDIVEIANAAIENGVRLSVYKTMVEKGYSRQKAATVASGLTVDFTKKGKYGGTMNALYLFSNAGVQGNLRMIQAIGRSPRARKIVGGIVATGFVMNILGMLMGGDDDDDIAHYDKLRMTDPGLFERNIVVMIPGGEGDHFKIPMPWGYNAFYNAGHELSNALYKTMTGDRYDPVKGSSRVMSGFANSFNPMASATLLQTIAPSILDPIAVVGENIQWHGGPLMPERNPFEKIPKPDSQRFFKSVSAPSKMVAQTVNRLTGGDTVKPGLIDVSPETLDMLYETATGSLGRFVRDVALLPMVKDVKNVPFIRRVYGKKSEYADSQIYYDRVKAILTLKEQIESDSKYLKNPNARYIPIAVKAEKELTKLRKQKRKAEAAGASTEIIDKRIDGVQKNFLKLTQKAS
jgi:GGDEF domain-containing protein